jgi:hypothetical protein
MSFKNKIIDRVTRRIFKADLICTIDGIFISSLRENNDGFAEIIGSALDMIRNHDPKRYERVKSEIDWIVNSSIPPKYGGMYQRSAKSCVINFENYSDDIKLVSAFYAGIVIHEATHGFIETKGFKYSRGNRLQIERICCSENNRFYKRIESLFPEYAGLLTMEFEPSDWDYSWETPRWKQLFHWLKREVKF